jgi:hypothetical protein
MWFSTIVHPIIIGMEDMSVGMKIGYRLDNRGTRIQFPIGQKDILFLQSAQSVSGFHPVSYPMRTGGIFFGDVAILRRFGGTYRLHLQDREVNQIRNQEKQAASRI